MLCLSTRANFGGATNVTALLISIMVNKVISSQMQGFCSTQSLVVVSTIAFAVLLQAVTTIQLPGTEPLNKSSLPETLPSHHEVVSSELCYIRIGYL
jgi:hypothetical protein